MKQQGMIDLAVLGLLKEQSMHGYQLRRQLTAKLGPFWQVSWGSLYPTLRRLARSGAVEKVTQSRPAARGSGHSRNVFKITGQGEKMFSALLEETAVQPDQEQFTLKLAFFKYLQPEKRVLLLERRRAYLQEKLAQFKENLRLYRERNDSYSLSLQNHGMAVVEDEIEWIEGLITDEKGALPAADGGASAARDTSLEGKASKAQSRPTGGS